MTKKLDLTLWTFNFVVRADSLNDSLKILKEVTGINASSSHSDREINGLYPIRCFVDDKDLTKDFYANIAKSDRVAIHSDDKSASLYPKILHETQSIEEQLRWLLLHVSDAIDDFAEQFSSKKDSQKKSDIITKKSLDPITSTLTFGAMVALLKLDQSWSRDGVSTERMRTLMDNSSDFDSFKKSYLENTTKKTIWDSISTLVLQKSVEWETIEDKLRKIRTYRNACAHLLTVTDDDLSQVQHLRKDLDVMLVKKKTIPKSSLNSLRILNEQLAQMLKTISQSYALGINTSALTALSSQIDTMKLSQSMQRMIEQSLPTDAILRSATNMIPRFDIPTPSQALIESLNRSINSMHGLYGIDENNDKDAVEEVGEDDITAPDSGAGDGSPSLSNDGDKTK